MIRHAVALLSVVLMAGCATNRSNYYSYDGNGDYYYGEGTADVVIDQSRYPFALGGYGAGFGYGSYCYPYSCGGYGYGANFWIPLAPQWIPSPSHQNSVRLRDARVERDRAGRSALTRRDTVQAPNSTKWLHDPYQSASHRGGARGNVDARAIQSSSARQPAAARSVAPVRQAPMMRSQPAPSRSASPPAPARSAPIPQRQ